MGTFGPRFIMALLNPTFHGVSDYVAPIGGGDSEFKEGVIFDPMLLHSICYFVFLGVT